MHGVINGIDYDYFSPKNTDIAFTYDKESLSEGKAKNKAALQEKLGLGKEPDTPLISMITRLTAGKGIDLVLDVLEGLLSKNVQLVILGTGDKEYEDKLSEIASRHTNFSALIKFDRVLSKEIYAASDIFLMPSKSEPCGLAQMIACSYGTVPIVRAVGGLEDSIIHYGNEKSNGFKFTNFDSTALWYALEEALRVYSSKEEFDRLRNQSYDSDFTWGISASKYITIYNNLLK
jgi:starch synthase